MLQGNHGEFNAKCAMFNNLFVVSAAYRSHLLPPGSGGINFPVEGYRYVRSHTFDLCVCVCVYVRAGVLLGIRGV